MRISTSQFHQLASRTMLEQQAEISRTQQQLASGKRLLTPADDPVGAARAMELSKSVAALARYSANADLAQSAVAQQESAYAQVGDLIQDVRELTVQMSNATQTNETRGFAAADVRQRLEHLLSLANSETESGQYLFAGTRSASQPFVSEGGVVRYAGDQGERSMQVSASRQIPVGTPGELLFNRIPQGNGAFYTRADAANSGNASIDGGSVSGNFAPDDYTLEFSQAAPGDPISYTITGAGTGPVASGAYTSGEPISFQGAQVTLTGTPANGDRFDIAPSRGQSLFSTLQTLADALDRPVNNPADQAKLNTTLGGSLQDLDQALGQFLTARADAGARLKELDSVRMANEEQTFNHQKALSVLQDTDYADAASRLSRQVLALEAAQRSYVQIKDLSLFNYLR